MKATQLKMTLQRYLKEHYYLGTKVLREESEN